MVEISTTGLVDAEQGAVFSALTDIANLPERIDGIIDMKLLTELPVGLGTRFTHRRRFAGLAIEREVRITDWDPPRRFVASFSVLGTHVDSLHVLEAEYEKTRIILTIRADPQGPFRPFALLVWWALSFYARRAIEQEVADIAWYFESLPVRSAPGGISSKGAFARPASGLAGRRQETASLGLPPR